MTERFEKLEAELASMRPRVVREEVVDEIDRALGLPLKRQARLGCRAFRAQSLPHSHPLTRLRSEARFPAD